MEEDRRRLVENAKVAEQAERYDDMATVRACVCELCMCVHVFVQCACCVQCVCELCMCVHVCVCMCVCACVCAVCVCVSCACMCVCV